MSVLITVIVPVYNAELYLHYCVERLSVQTYPVFELLLIDDGSTDDSLSVCRQLAEKDERIRVFHRENGGVSAARNLGLENAQGEYVTFVDADDIVAPDYLERLLKGVREENAVLSITTFARIRSYEEELSNARTPFLYLPAISCVERLLGGHFPVHVCGALFDRKRIGDLRFPVGIRNNEDKYFLYCYLLNNEVGTVAFTNDKMYGYYVREGSATKSGWNGSRDVIWVADQIAERTATLHPEWKDLTDNLCLWARFDVLNSILRSGRKDKLARKTFSEVRREAISFPFPKTGDKRLKVEYITLRLGTVWYRLLVWTYYKLNSENKRFQLNEKKIQQG